MSSVIQTNPIRKMDPEFRADPSATTEDRVSVARTIASLLYSLHCREEGVRLVRLQDAAQAEAAPFYAMGELAVQSILNPDLERVAIFAGADILARDQMAGAEPFAISELTDRAQGRLFEKAKAVIRAYRDSLAFESPDPYLDKQYDDRLQVLEQQGLVKRG